MLSHLISSSACPTLTTNKKRECFDSDNRGLPLGGLPASLSWEAPSFCQVHLISRLSVRLYLRFGTEDSSVKSGIRNSAWSFVFLYIKCSISAIVFGHAEQSSSWCNLIPESKYYFRTCKGYISSTKHPLCGFRAQIRRRVSLEPIGIVNIKVKENGRQVECRHQSNTKMRTVDLMPPDLVHNKSVAPFSSDLTD